MSARKVKDVAERSIQECIDDCVKHLHPKTVAPSTERISDFLKNRSANGRQVGGNHYQKYEDLQPWDVFIPWNLNPFQAAVVKYVVRYRDKGGVKDLEKCIHYLEKLIEIEKERGGS